MQEWHLSSKDLLFYMCTFIEGCWLESIRTLDVGEMLINIDKTCMFRNQAYLSNSGGFRGRVCASLVF